MSNPYFLRKYRVRVIDGNDVALDVSDLRVKFNIQRVGYQAINYGDIEIYNLSAQTEVYIVKYGMRVTIEAGYENGQYGKIFDGDVFQPLWEREQVTDYKLTLHCFDGDSQLNNNFIGMTVQASHDQRTDLLAIMENARNTFGSGQISSDISSIKMPRGRVFFGMPKTHFRQIARANNAQWSYQDRQLMMSKLTDVPQGEALVISPSSGLIGSPQQTQDGVQFRTLLNPAVSVQFPAMQVKLDMASIRQEKILIGQLQTRLDQDGLYYVAAVNHIGDTRGNEWYTDITGFNTSTGKLAAMYESAAQNLN